MASVSITENLAECLYGLRPLSLTVEDIIKLCSQYGIIFFSIKDTNLAVVKFVEGTAAVGVGRNSITQGFTYHIFSCQENRSLIFSTYF